MTETSIESFARASLEYGPFLFAILFNLVITRWAYKMYNAAVTRVTPSASQEEKSTYRTYFFAVVACGIVLVIASVTWWFYAQTFPYVYRGVIQSLKDFEKVTSNTLYFKKALREPDIGATTQYRDEYFLVLQDKPFRDTDEFELRFSKGKPDDPQNPGTSLKIRYVKGSEPKLTIEWDPEKNANVLKGNPPGPKNVRSFFNYVYAEPYQPVSNPTLQISDDTLGRGFILLRDERTAVGIKIRVLDGLLEGPTKVSPEELQEYLQQPSPGEQRILTLLDLTRHTDKELASKAKKLLGLIDVQAFVANQYLSGNESAKNAAKDILFRIEPALAKKIMDKIVQANKAKPIANAAEMEQLRKDINTAGKSKVLIPTGSEEGDRYYVNAHWDSRNQTTIRCLTRLFNEQLISTRSPREEEGLMAGRTDRLVYWYSKGWALSIAQKIEGCGGWATFVGK